MVVAALLQVVAWAAEGDEVQDLAHRQQQPQQQQQQHHHQQHLAQQAVQPNVLQQQDGGSILAAVEQPMPSPFRSPPHGQQGLYLKQRSCLSSPVDVNGLVVHPLLYGSLDPALRCKQRKVENSLQSRPCSKVGLTASGIAAPNFGLGCGAPFSSPSNSPLCKLQIQLMN
eukprot:1066522-Pelagomonas_calceolata.AAC.2